MKLSKSVETVRQFDTDHPYISSVGRGALKFATGKAIQYAGKKAGVDIRHGRSQDTKRNELFEKHKILSAVGMSVIVPAAEELFWRHGPAKITEHFTDNQRIHRAVQIGMLALFTAQHAGKDGLPLNQMLGGANYQDIYNRHGFAKSTLSHITNNTLAVASHVIEKQRGLQVSSGADSDAITRKDGVLLINTSNQSDTTVNY